VKTISKREGGRKPDTGRRQKILKAIGLKPSKGGGYKEKSRIYLWRDPERTRENVGKGKDCYKVKQLKKPISRKKSLPAGKEISPHETKGVSRSYVKKRTHNPPEIERWWGKEKGLPEERGK